MTLSWTEIALIAFVIFLVAGAYRWLRADPVDRDVGREGPPGGGAADGPGDDTDRVHETPSDKR